MASIRLRCGRSPQRNNMELVGPNVFRYDTRAGARYMARVEHNGHQVRRKGFLTPKQAADWLTLFRADLINQKYFPHLVEPPLLSELAERWLAQCAKKNLRHNTLRSYRANLFTHILPFLGSRPINRITRTDIADFVASKKTGRARPYSRDAIRLMLAPLSCLFSDVLDEGRYGVESNPCLRPGRLINIKTRKKPLKAYAPAEEAAILEACKRIRPDQYELFCTLFWAGLRPGEAWALLPADIDLKRKRLSISKTFSDGELHDTPKTGQTRVVEIPEKLVKVLRPTTNKFPKSTILVFPGRGGVHRHQSMWNKKIWTPIVTAAGVPRYPPYATRHSYATRQLQAGCSLQWLMHQMGHSSIKLTVDTYGHLARTQG